MKTFKQLTLSFGIIGLVLILSIGGCKKELSSDSAKLKNADLLMSKEAGPGKKKVLRQSPGLKIEVKGETIERISPTLKSIDKITSILNEEQSKKNQGGVMTTKSVNFTASLAGTYYNCYAELNDPGPYDWYLINWYTGVYTYIGSSTDYINFNVQKPSMYGSYRVWGEGPYGAGFTGYQYMGDPYAGVSKVGGILSFTNVAAYDALKTRLRTAYDNHQTLLDAYDLMSDDAADAQAVVDGFDEFLPYKEFEAYFGFSSLRAQIRAEVVYWQSQSNEYGTGYPEDNYVPYSYEQQTMMTTQGKIEVGGVGEGPMSLNIFGDGKNPSNPGPYTCMVEADMAEHRDITSTRKVKMYVYIDPVAVEGGTTTLFSGRTRTMKRQLGFLWKDKLERQQVKISGNQYNGCIFETDFDSGWANTANKRKYMMDVDYSAGPGRQSKSGEITTSVLLNEYSSTPFTLTYTH